MRLLWLVVVVTACSETSSVTCSDGRVCPAALACDDVHGTCVLEEQLGRCTEVMDGDPCEVEGIAGVCDKTVCMLPVCGDGFQQLPELCDGNDLGDSSCTDLGFYETGTPACNATCGYDTAACRGFCGDGQLTPGFEICETDRPPTESCVDYGYGAGVLACLSCGPGFDGCKSFEWDAVSFGGPPLDMHGIADNDVYAVLGTWGISHFDGEVWKDVTADCLGASDYLMAVWQTAPNVVMVGGYGFVVRVDNGACTKWMTADGNQVVDLWASGPNDIYAAALSGVWHFDGTGWTQVVTESSVGVWGSGPSNVYASIGGEYRHFNGTSWSAPQAVLGIEVINAIWGTSATDVFVGGITSLGSDGNAIVKHTTNGTQWTSVLEDEPVLSTQGSNIIKGFSVGGRTYVAATEEIDGTSRPLLLASDGPDWVDLVAPVYGVGFIWASNQGRIFATSGFGTTAVTLEGNVLIDHGEPVSSTYQKLAGTSSNNVYRAVAEALYRWNGSTWTYITAWPIDVATDPSGNAYGIADLNGFFPSTNGWTMNSAIDGTRLTAPATKDVWILDDDDNDHRVVRWLDGEVTTFPYASGLNMQDIWAASPNDVFVVGQVNDTTFESVILRRNGNGWDTMDSGTYRALSVVWGLSATEVYAGGNGVLLRYNGTTWSPFMPESPVSTVFDIWGRAADDLFVVGHEGAFHFNGTQWSRVDAGAPFSVRAIAGAGDSVFWTDYNGAVHQLVRTIPW